jgi:acyl-CoA thioesterase FadM
MKLHRLDARFPAAAHLGVRLEIRTGLRRGSEHRACFDQRVLVAGIGRAVVEACAEVSFEGPQQGPGPMPSGFLARPAPATSPGAAPPPIFAGEPEHYRQRQSQRVYDGDTDAQGDVDHVSYVRWFEQAVEALLAPEDPGFRCEAVTIRSLAAARLGDRLEILLGARPLEGEGRVVVDLQVLRRSDGVAVADGFLHLAFEDTRGAPAALPGGLAGLLS